MTKSLTDAKMGLYGAVRWLQSNLWSVRWSNHDGKRLLLSVFIWCFSYFANDECLLYNGQHLVITILVNQEPIVATMALMYVAEVMKLTAYFCRLLLELSGWQGELFRRPQSMHWKEKRSEFLLLRWVGWLIDWLIDWLSSVLRPRQHSIGYTGDGFYRSKDSTNSIKLLKEKAVKENNTKNRKKTKIRWGGFCHVRFVYWTMMIVILPSNWLTSGHLL